MKISASNIAWNSEDDHQVYQILKSKGFSGIEIAPTRLIPDSPYNIENRSLAVSMVSDVRNEWGLSICSMQSLWFGLTERLFGTEEEREFLYQYTRSAIDFAAAVGCPHMVFGNPRNRVIDHQEKREVGKEFFLACAMYAETKRITIGIEANPTSYGTNYLNTNAEAVELIKSIDSPSLCLNLDLGSVLENEEDLDAIEDYIPYVSHVHISEPSLAPIETDRPEHHKLARILKKNSYTGWVSLEMRNSGMTALAHALDAVSRTFGE